MFSFLEHGKGQNATGYEKRMFLLLWFNQSCVPTPGIKGHASSPKDALLGKDSCLFPSL